MKDSANDNSVGMPGEIVDWTESVIAMRKEIEDACGSSNSVTSKRLAVWDEQMLLGNKTGQELAREIAMQTVITDYLINERLNGVINAEEFTTACRSLKEEHGMDDLYARILSLVAGSGKKFIGLTSSVVDRH